MADLNKPVKTDGYEDVLSFIKENAAAILTLIDSRNAVPDNIPALAKRWNNENGYLESWESSAWVTKVISVAGGGTGAANAADARTSLGCNNASNLNAGTLNSGRLPTVPVSKGGTGLTTLTTGSFLCGNGTGNVTLRTPAQVASDMGLGTAAYAAITDFSASTHDATSSGVHGVSGSVVGTSDAQDLSNKTLITPTIASFANAAHDHSSAAGGGNLAASAITSGVFGASRVSAIVGSRVAKSHNTLYQAATDGEVTFAFASTSGDTSQMANVGPTAGLGTLLLREWAGGSTWGSMSFMVKKNEYWKVSTEAGAAPTSVILYFTPIGS